MILVIPIDGTAVDQQFTLELQRVVYAFRFVFNSRDERWYMSMFLEDGTPLIEGTPLTTGMDLLGRFRTEQWPPGSFVVLDTTGRNLEPRRDAFLGSHILLYREG
jgi:hypothetical protein